jgi:hypothetical protein
MKSAITMALLCSGTILLFIAAVSSVEAESELERHRDTTWLGWLGASFVSLSFTLDRIWPG